MARTAEARAVGTAGAGTGAAGAGAAAGATSTAPAGTVGIAGAATGEAGATGTAASGTAGIADAAGATSTAASGTAGTAGAAAGEAGAGDGATAEVPAAGTSGGHAAGAAGVAAAPAIPRLNVVGPDILGPNGDAVLLRGVNWGWWGEAIEEDASIIRHELGANVVRTAVRWYYWGSRDNPDHRNNARDSDSPGHINPEHLAILDSNVQWLSEQGLWIILFASSDQGRGENEANFANTPALRQEFIEMWQFWAERYRDVPYLGAFEVLAEPRFAEFGRDVSKSQLRDLYQEIIDGIMSVTGDSIPFVIGAMDFYRAANLTSEYHLPGYEIIYAANHYHAREYTQGTAPYGYPSAELDSEDIAEYLQQPLAFRDQFQVPVWADQFGASRDAIEYLAYTSDIIAFFESESLHWTYWNWRQRTGGRGAYEPRDPDSDEYVRNVPLFDLLDAALPGEE